MHLRSRSDTESISARTNEKGSFVFGVVGVNDCGSAGGDLIALSSFAWDGTDGVVAVAGLGRDAKERR